MSKKISSKLFENVHPILPKSKVLSPIGNVVNKRKLSRDEVLVNSIIVPSNPAKRRRLMDKIIPKLLETEFILLGDYDQLDPIEDKNYDYRNSLILKEIVEGNIQVLTENHRFRPDMLDVLNRIDTIKGLEFGQKMCRINICATNNALAVIKGATFKVTKLNPLTVKDTKTKKVTVISSELFQDYFYVNFCTTSHKVQGQTIKEEFTIHEFKGMRKKMKYVALSRATSKNLINVCRTEYKVAKELLDTDFEKIKSQEKEDTPLESKRKAAIGVLHRIIKGQATEEYCIKHTGLNREALLSHLGITDGIVWKGYELDHSPTDRLLTELLQQIRFNDVK